MKVHTACAMSHIKLWEKIVAMGAPTGQTTSMDNDDGEDALFLILEDDVRFYKQWQSVLVDIIATLRANKLDGPGRWSGLLYLDAMDTTGWDLSKHGLVV